MSQKKLFEQAKQIIPGGVNSPVRAFKAVGGNPIFMKKASGAYLWDEDGKKYIDYCAAWGPMLFGHAPKSFVSKVQKSIASSTAFGTATKNEVLLAKKIKKFFPVCEKVRLVNSGTESTMTAIRLARGFTKRSKVLKIDGGYHGHVDSLLIQAGSGATTLGVPDSAGIPKEFAKLTLSIPFNDEKALENVFKKHGKDIAAFILEPVPANMGVILPKKGYLEKVRKITKKYGTVLIFDEVMTGFRTTEGGAQKYFKVKPDLVCLGKIVGGGLPLAVLGGQKEIMNHLAPVGPVYQAGTLSGNPIAVTAALWALEKIEKSKPHKALNKKCEKFYKKLQAILDKKRTPLQLNTIGSMFTIFFNENSVENYADAKKSDTQKYGAFFRKCLNRGVYIVPAQFEANFISTEHTEKILAETLRVFEESLA